MDSNSEENKIMPSKDNNYENWFLEAGNFSLKKKKSRILSKIERFYYNLLFKDLFYNY